MIVPAVTVHGILGAACTSILFTSVLLGAVFIESRIIRVIRLKPAPAIKVLPKEKQTPTKHCANLTSSRVTHSQNISISSVMRTIKLRLETYLRNSKLVLSSCIKTCPPPDHSPSSTETKGNLPVFVDSPCPSWWDDDNDEDFSSLCSSDDLLSIADGISGGKYQPMAHDKHDQGKKTEGLSLEAELRKQERKLTKKERQKEERRKKREEKEAQEARAKVESNVVSPTLPETNDTNSCISACVSSCSSSILLTDTGSSRSAATSSYDDMNTMSTGKVSRRMKKNWKKSRSCQLGEDMEWDRSASTSTVTSTMSSESEECPHTDDIQLDCAFVKNALNKCGMDEVVVAEKSQAPLQESIDTAASIARKAADLATEKNYKEAIVLYSKALSLHENSRFYFNRAYCHERCGHFAMALKDADKSIQLDPNYIKGHYRRATVLLALQRPHEAIRSYENILKIDKTQEQVREALVDLATSQLMELGFRKGQSLKAITTKKTFDTALDALLNDQFRDVEDSATEDDDDEDDEDDECADGAIQQPSHSFVHKPTTSMFQQSNSSYTVTTNGPSSLWVGNVLPTVGKNRLHQLFSTFGKIKSVADFPNKFHAFINFESSECAALAMTSLQGHNVEGQRLWIKYPEKYLNNKPQTTETAMPKPSITDNELKNHNAHPDKPKLRGPLNGNECYFWHTSGCRFGEACIHDHIPGNQGISYKGWMA